MTESKNTRACINVPLCLTHLHWYETKDKLFYINDAKDCTHVCDNDGKETPTLNLIHIILLALTMKLAILQ